MVKLQTTMNSYVKWLTHRDNLVGEKGVPSSVLGRTMIAHGEDFDRDSQFGNCLIEMGRANDQVAQIQEQYAQDATRYWSDSVERSVAMMKEYQVFTHFPSPSLAIFVLNENHSYPGRSQKARVPSSCPRRLFRQNEQSQARRLPS